MQYLKLCRANRGNCLVETLKNSFYKTMRDGWDSLSINLAKEKVNIYKQFGTDMDAEESSNAYVNVACKAITQCVKGKKLVEGNAQIIQELNLKIKETSTQVDETTEQKLKLDRLIDQSNQPMPVHLKVMQFAYTMGQIVANRWAKRAEFSRCVAETYKSEAMDTVGANEDKVVEIIRLKLREGYKTEIDTNYKMEKMKINSQVRTVECKYKQ